MPIQQWLYFDAIECLPANSLEVLTEADCQPVNLIICDMSCSSSCCSMFIVVVFAELCGSSNNS